MAEGIVEGLSYRSRARDLLEKWARKKLGTSWGGAEWGASRTSLPRIERVNWVPNSGDSNPFKSLTGDHSRGGDLEKKKKKMEQKKHQGKVCGL